MRAARRTTKVVVMQSWSATAVFLDGFGRQPELVEAALDGLSEDELAHQIAPDANTVAWLVWHTARMQDVQIAGLAQALGRPEASGVTEQVWTAGGFREQFDLPLHSSDGRYGDMGYGDSPEQVAAVRAPAELLTAYHGAVHQRTVDVIASLVNEEYAAVVDEQWDPPVTALVRLVSVLDDAAQHLGQAAFVRGVIERGRQRA